MDRDRAVRQSGTTPLLGDCVAKHGADSSVHITNRHRERHRDRIVDGGLRLRDELLIERNVETVILRDRLVQCLAVLVLRHCEDRADIQTRRLPMRDRGTGVEHLDMTNHLGHRCKAKLRHQLTNFLGDELHEVDDEFGLAAEAGAQLRILCGNTHRTCVEVTDTHHYAATHHQRCRCEAELFRAEQRGHHHVAAGLQLAVGLYHDAVAQAVEQQRLLRLGEAELPWTTRVFERRER